MRGRQFNSSRQISTSVVGLRVCDGDIIFSKLPGFLPARLITARRIAVCISGQFDFSFGEENQKPGSRLRYLRRAWWETWILGSARSSRRERPFCKLCSNSELIPSIRNLQYRFVMLSLTCNCRQQRVKQIPGDIRQKHTAKLNIAKLITGMYIYQNNNMVLYSWLHNRWAMYVVKHKQNI